MYHSLCSLPICLRLRRAIQLHHCLHVMTALHTQRAQQGGTAQAETCAPRLLQAMPAAVVTLLPHFLLPKPLNSSGSLTAASFFLGAFLGAAPLPLPLLQQGEGGAGRAGVRLVFTV